MEVVFLVDPSFWSGLRFLCWMDYYDVVNIHSPLTVNLKTLVIPQFHLQQNYQVVICCL